MLNLTIVSSNCMKLKLFLLQLEKNTVINIYTSNVIYINIGTRSTYRNPLIAHLFQERITLLG